MTRKELSETLSVSLRTLDNWEKEKPELVRLINQGFALDASIEATRIIIYISIFHFKTPLLVHEHL